MSAEQNLVNLTSASLSAAAMELDPSIQPALLAAIVNGSDDAILSKTLDGRLLSWNAGATRLFGHTVEEAIGKPIMMLVPDELQEEERSILRQLRRGEHIDHFETIRLAKDGRRVSVSLTVSPVRNTNGEIVAASIIARDISERKLAEQLLSQSRTQLAAEASAFAKLNDSTARLWRCRNLHEGLEQMLGAAIDLLGAERGNVQLLDATNRVLRIAAQRGFRYDFLELFREVSATDESFCGRVLRSGGTTIVEDVELDAAHEPYRAIARATGYRSLISSPLIGNDGARLGMVSLYFPGVHRPSEQELRRLDLLVRQGSDFVVRCKMERALFGSEKALREADQRKDEFLALLAHELRNALAPVRYLMGASKGSARTGNEQTSEDIIERQVAHMSRLLDDLLDISRIKHGGLELKKVPAELAPIIGAAVDAARPILDLKNHSLSLDLPQEPMWLDADPVRLAQVFSNLLINAAKYTDAGGRIELRAVRKGWEIAVIVRDNGIGISAEMMPRLFTLFSRGGSGTDRSEGGLGIGLALVRGLVTLHDGRVEARSNGPHQGSEFAVYLPLGKPISDQPELEVGKVPAGSASVLKVLIVDDSRDAADTCATVLGLCGHDARTAYSAKAALEMARTFRPHAYLLDIGMPELNGYELAREIRAAPWGRSATLIALTGWGNEEDRRRASEAGFDHHLTKPIAVEALESLLQSVDGATTPTWTWRTPEAATLG